MLSIIHIEHILEDTISIGLVEIQYIVDNLWLIMICLCDFIDCKTICRN